MTFIPPFSLSHDSGYLKLKNRHTFYDGNVNGMSYINPSLLDAVFLVAVVMAAQRMAAMLLMVQYRLLMVQYRLRMAPR
jgi:hypothetical protein